jgi:hypothetical protein
MSQGSDNLTVQPVENKDETVSEDEKVKNYLNNLKAKLSEQVDPPKVESEDDKVKNYLENLKNKMAVNIQQPQSNQDSSTVSKDYFDNRVKEYLSKNKVKLYILTPCYGGLCHVNYILKIMETKEALEKLGIKIVLQFIRNESLITRGRNNLVAKSMSDPEMTHILFIDSDITWEPIHVIKLIIADKELVGGIYPIKKYHWDRLTPENIKNMLDRKKSAYNQPLSDTQMIYHNLLHYNFNYLTEQNKIENNLMEIYTLATGFMMIQRSCIDKMIKAHPQCKYTDDCGFLHGEENRFAYSLFDCAIVNDHYYSEDWLFCHRWRLIGGRIFVDITIDLWHTGQEDYQGRLISTLNIGA